MAHAPLRTSRLPRTWLPAILISIIISTCCAAGLYVLLAQQDRSLVTQRNAAMVLATEESARAMARTVAWFGESLIGDNLATMQRTLEQHAKQSNWLDAAVITEDNTVVATSNPITLGTQLHDPVWLAARKNQGGSITAGMDHGRPVMIVIEPFRQQNRIVGWIRLVVALPPNSATLRSEDDLGRDVALVIGPFFIMMILLLSLTMRGLMRRVRALLLDILTEAKGQALAPIGNRAEPSERG